MRTRYPLIGARMIDFEIEIRDDLVIRSLGDLDKAKIYAAEEALNDTAFGVRRDIFVPEVRAQFDLSNNFLTKGLREGAKGPGGIGVEKANRNRLSARIFFGEGADFLRLHEEGGTKRPPSGGEGIVIPEPETFGAKVKRIRKGQLLKLARGSGGRASRVFEVGKGTPRHRIVERLPGRQAGRTAKRSRKGWITGRSKVRNRTVRVLAWLEAKATIRQVLRAEKSSLAYVRRHLPQNFERRFNKRLAKLGRSTQ